MVTVQVNTTGPQPVPISPSPQPPPRPEVGLRIRDVESSLLKREEAEREIEKLNEELKSFNTRLKFGLFAETDQFFVEIVDQQTNEVIKVVPALHLLELRARLQEGFGLLLDETA